MVSLLTWDWKTEPVSPPTLYEDTVLLDDSSTTSDLTAFDIQSSIVKDEDELADIGSSGNKAEVFSKLLEEIEDFDHLEEFIKEESFSNWFEGKAELPIFEDIPIEPARSYPVQRFKTEELKPLSEPFIINQQQNEQDTSLLLREFETVFDAVEMTHNTLTPPQSPPCTENHAVITTLTPMVNNFSQPIIQPVFYQPIPERIAVSISAELQPATPQPDVAHELAVVEELVRSRAENMVNAWEDNGSSEQVISPSSPSSSSSSGFSEYSSDPEWIPEPIHSPEDYVIRATKSRKRAGKPYSRAGPEDKKSRKKEQNKNAATRYRQKKKAEVEVILSEEKGLIEHHDGLETKVTDLQREIKYLKGLMRDLFKAKGLIQ